MDSNQIIFLSYINRSGSTYLAEQISAHPDVCVCPEAEVLIRLFLRAEDLDESVSSGLKSLEHALRHDAKLSEWGISFIDVKDKVSDSRNSTDIFQKFLFAYRDIVKPGAKKVIFKGTELLKVYENMKPEERPLCIVITRDGRAAYASQKKSKGSLSGRPMHVSPVVAAKQWLSFTERVLSLGTIMHIKYEDLVMDLNTKMQEVWSFLGLQAPTEKSLDGDLTTRIPENQKHLHVNVGRDPILSRIDSWKKELTDAEITLFEVQAGDLLAKLDYTLIKPSRQNLVLAIQKRVFALKHFGNQLLNKILLRINNK